MSKNLNNMIKMINSIREARITTGEEHPQHEKIWEEIEKLYDKLNYREQEEFNDYCN